MNLGGIQNQAAPKTEYAPINDGIYPVKVLEVTPGKQSKSSEMVYTEVTFVISDGEFEGRRLWERFPEKNASAAAQKVGLDRITKLSKTLLGPSGANDILNGKKGLDVLVDKQLSVKVKNKGKFTNITQFMAS